MKPATVLKAVSEHSGPIVLSGGAALLAAALATSAHYQPEAANPPRPGPTVTVTQTPAPVAAPSPRRTPAPSPSTSGPQPAATVVAAAMRQAAMPNTGSGQSHTQARPPSAPSPSRAAPCSGRVLTVRALSDRACLSIGR